MSETMTVWEVQGAFGLHSLVRARRPVPEPGPGQLLLRVKASCLNYRDLLMVQGAYDPRLTLPFVPLSDGVGEVVAVGAGAKWPVGARVCPLFSPSWKAGSPTLDDLRLTRGGSLEGLLAEYVVVGDDEVVEAPEHLTDEEAATLPCAALTAWSALVTLGQLKAGDTVLTLGTGGVSLFAVQIAKLFGARVVSTTSTAAKESRLRALGSDHVVLYTEDERWGRTIRKWSGGGVDHVVEVGGAGTLQQSLDAVRPGGTVSVIGVLGGHAERLSVLPVLMRQIRVQGVFVGSKRSFEEMCRALSLYRIRPVLDRSFAFAQADEAFGWFAERKHVGKVTLRH